MQRSPKIHGSPDSEELNGNSQPSNVFRYDSSIFTSNTGNISGGSSGTQDFILVPDRSAKSDKSTSSSLQYGRRKKKTPAERKAEYDAAVKKMVKIRSALDPSRRLSRKKKDEMQDDLREVQRVFTDLRRRCGEL